MIGQQSLALRSMAAIARLEQQIGLHAARNCSSFPTRCKPTGLPRLISADWPFSSTRICSRMAYFRHLAGATRGARQLGVALRCIRGASPHSRGTPGETFALLPASGLIPTFAGSSCAVIRGRSVFHMGTAEEQNNRNTRKLHSM